MTPVTHALPISVPQEVLDFASEQGVLEYLPAVLEMTRKVFPTAPLSIEVSYDPEIVDDGHIVLDVVVPANVNLAMAAQRRWNDGLFASCPAPLVCVFRLGMDLVDE